MISSPMLCPFHLDEIRKFQELKVDGGPATVFACPQDEPIPRLYLDGYRRYPPVVLSTVGFRAHGKSMFFASLFATLKSNALARGWPEFSMLSLNEETFDWVWGAIGELRDGRLPAATPKVFPRPGLLRLSGLPLRGKPRRTLLCYDTAGESYRSARDIGTYASFVSRARTVLFLVSVSGLDHPDRGLEQLLETYVHGITELGGRRRQQHLVVVFTKAEEIEGLVDPAWEDIARYLEPALVDDIPNSKRYLGEMKRVSRRLDSFTEEALGATGFRKLAADWFASVEFCAISSLGATPFDGRLTGPISPRRILDPLLWVLVKDTRAGGQ